MNQEKERPISAMSKKTSKSSIESRSIAQQAGLRQIVINKEAPVVILPLDSTSHSSYCLLFYVKYMHKPEDKIHVCYVAEDYYRKQRKASTTSNKPVSDQKLPKKGCLACLFTLRNLIASKPSMPMIMDVMGPSPGIVKELERQDRANCHLVRLEAKDVFSSNGIKNWDFKLITGEDPWTAILDFTEQMKGTMIILGSRGLSTIRRNIFGSVSDKVLHRSPVPVMVVKQPESSSYVTAGVSAID